MPLAFPKTGLMDEDNPLNGPRRVQSGPPVPIQSGQPGGNGNSKGLLALLAPIIGAALGGSKGFAYGAAGLSGYQRGAERREKNILNQEEIGLRRAHEERRTKAAERQADALEDKTRQEKWTWDSNNRVFISNQGNVKQPAVNVPAPPEKEEKGIYDQNRGVIVFPSKGEFKVLEGLPSMQFAPERPATPRTPTPAPYKFDSTTGHKMGWNTETGTYDIDMGLPQPKGEEKRSAFEEKLKRGNPLNEGTDFVGPPSSKPTFTPAPGRTPAPKPTLTPTPADIIGDALRIQKLLKKINPETGKAFTEAEALAYIAAHR